MKKILDCTLMIIGGLGALVLALMAIANRKADDLLSVIPVTMVCCSMFIAGYLSYFKEK